MPDSFSPHAGEKNVGAEELFRQFVGIVDLTAELVGVLCIAYGVVEAAVMSVRVVIRRHVTIRRQRKEIFARFASWIILALEFALAADIVRTAVAPTWNDVGLLAAIAAIRTALNYFLERDLDALDSDPRTRPRHEPAPSEQHPVS
jgi:uncharacterized membrane protein